VILVVLPNGLELSCPAARATAHSFSRIPAGNEPSNFAHASRVSCSELLGGFLELWTRSSPEIGRLDTGEG